MSKLGQLLRHPSEISVRVANKLDVLSDRAAVRCGLEAADAGTLPQQVHHLLGAPAEQLQQETAPIGQQIRAAIDEWNSDEPFEQAHNATSTFAELCYYVARLLRPGVVVETGVANGVTSTYILHALETSGCGKLHSIDLPPLAENNRAKVGVLVPERFRPQWDLSLGSASAVLPSLLQRTGPVDLFIHDSLHTLRNMTFEFETVLQHMRPGGVILADDIEGNQAFEYLTKNARIASWFVIRQQGKTALCGAARIAEERLPNR